MDGTTLREDCSEDVWRRPLLKTYLQVWDAPHWNAVDRDEAEAKADHAFHPDSTLLLATTGDAVIGFAWARPLDDRGAPLPDDPVFQERVEQDAAYLESMGVVPTHRRKGIGKQLLEALISRLEPIYPQVVLRTTHDAAAAVQLYETHGFEDIEVPDPEEPDRSFFVRPL